MQARRTPYVRNASRCFRNALARTFSECNLSVRSGCFGPITLTRDVMGRGMSRPSSRGCVDMGDDFRFGMTT
jgi:hypothetical protein